jgi:hypothetical protein
MPVARDEDVIDDDFDAAEVEVGLGMLEAVGSFDMGADLLELDVSFEEPVEAGVRLEGAEPEVVFDTAACEVEAEAIGTFAPIDLRRLAISTSLRPSPPAALTLRLSPLGPGQSPLVGRSLTLLVNPPGNEPTFFNRTVLISFRNAAILSLGTLTVGCLILPPADFRMLSEHAVELASVGRNAARALTKSAPLSRR